MDEVVSRCCKGLTWCLLWNEVVVVVDGNCCIAVVSVVVVVAGMGMTVR